MSKVAALRVSCALVAICTASSVIAQTAPTEPTPLTADATSKESSGGVGDIIVTARRREESLQNVPVAITAFSKETLERKSIYDVFSLNKAVPGLTVTGLANTVNFSVRGRGTNFGSASGSVESYFADVPLSSPFNTPSFAAPFFDLQSVQVLKGPQGTLFGRNTTGGAVLFVPQAPEDKFGGYARASVGNYNAYQLEGAVNLPLGDDAALRIAGFRSYRKGYTRTTGLARNPVTGASEPVTDPYGDLLGPQRFDNQDVRELRATLKVRLSDSFTNSTIVSYHDDRNRASTQITHANPVSFYGPLVFAYYTATGGVPNFLTDGPRVAELDTNLSRPRRANWAIINTSTLDLSDTLTVKNIFGYVHASGFGGNPTDADGSPGPIVNLPLQLRSLKNNQYTNEVQLQGRAFGDSLSYIVGGLVDLTRQPGGLGSLNIVTNTQATGGGVFDTQFRQSRYTSKSVFASATYRAADTLSFTAGIRHTWDDITERSCEYNATVAQTSAAGCVAVNAAMPGNVNGFLVGSKNFKGFSYNASAEWRPADDSLIYGGYRRGYKRGGFNAKGVGIDTFDPETVDNFYLGIKQNLHALGARGHFNIEGFWDNYFNAQRANLTFTPGVGLATTIQNAPKSRYRGLDVDAGIEVAPWLELNGFYTFIDAGYTKFPDNTCSISGPAVGLPAGTYCFQLGGFNNGVPGFVPVSVVAAVNPGDQGSNPVGFVSKHKLSTSARFHTTLSDGGEIAFAPTFNYQSRFYSGDVGRRLSNSAAALFGPVNAEAAGVGYASGYSTVDLRAEWNGVLGSKLNFAINANNILNKTFIVAPSTIYQLGVGADAFGPPRLVTAELKVRF